MHACIGMQIGKEMEREINLDEISDGKLYQLNDLVKVGCNDCKGCSACCSGMGNTILIDPYDSYQMQTSLHLTFEELWKQHMDLQVANGMVLPNLKMAEKGDDCTFLKEDGRCSIHSFRPGICRLFPLGRIYENHSFQYFLQVHECVKENKTKVKVRKWLDIPNAKEYEAFVIAWHYLLLDFEAMAKQLVDGDMEQLKQLSMYLLQHFYLTPFLSTEDFYTQFKNREQEARKEFGL